MPVSYKRLVGLYEQKDPAEANDLLREAMGWDESGRRAEGRPDVDPRSISLGRLFEECFGSSEYLNCKRYGRDYLATDVMSKALSEASGAVSTAAFLNIQGQIVYSMIMEPYNEVAAVFTPRIPEVPTSFLDGEKIAGITEIGDEVQIRPEAQPYALAGVGEDWIFTPPTFDRGLIVPVTWEAIFADRTGVLDQRCKDVGKWGGINREKRAIDVTIDENVTAHRYNWRGTVIATYGDNSGTHTWDNLNATNGLVDWNQLNTVEQNDNAITDPYTGEVVDVELTELIVPKALEETARRIVRQGSIRFTSPGYATSGNVTQHEGDNPYGNKYEIVTSKRLAPRMAVKTSWYLANMGAAFRYMQVEKPAVMMAPANNLDEFHRRVVNQYRWNERGAYTTIQPRASQKSTVA